MDFSKYVFKKFDGFRDFAFWKSKVRNHLRFLGLEVQIESEPVNNSTTNKPEPADWAKNNQANAFIRECLCDSLYQRYDLKSAKELWDKLKADYEKKDAQQCFILLRKFNNCVKEKKETMMDFISRLKSLRSELEGANHTVSDQTMILTLLLGCNNDFGDYVSAVTSKKATNEIVLEDLINLLIREDEYRRASLSVCVTQSENNSRHIMYMGSDQSSKKKKKMTSTHKRNCYNCGEAGHYANDCKKPRKVRSEVHKVLDKSKQNNHRKPKDDDGRSYQCSLREPAQENKSYQCSLREPIEWIQDSGASSHSCNDRSRMEDIVPCRSTIIVGDDRSVEVLGHGTVRLEVMANDKVNVIVLKDVALAPKLAINAVSTSRLEMAGYKIITYKGKTSIYLEEELVYTATRSVYNNLYILDTVSKTEYERMCSLSNSKSIESKEMCSSSDSLEISSLFEYGETCSSSETEEVCFSSKSGSASNRSSPKTETKWMMWHKRLGHLSDRYMIKLLPEMKLKSQFCEDCALCKSTQLPHRPKTVNQAKLEKTNGLNQGVIHSDLMGPVRIESRSGCRYVLTYLCGHSEFSFTYLMKLKSEQTECFKTFKAEYERMAKWRIKELRSDNGVRVRERYLKFF